MNLMLESESKTTDQQDFSLNGYQIAGVILVVVGAFFWLAPKFAATFFAYRRESQLNQFISQVKAQGEIDPKLWWQTREFYSPGVFKLNNNLIELGETQKIVKVATTSSELVTYESRFIGSTESVAASALIPKLFNDKKLQGKTIVFADSDDHVYFSGETTLVVEFWRSLPVMKQTVGLFDFKGKELDILKNQVWLHQSIITVPKELKQNFENAHP